MSLRVWLPLNGNLNNQGLSDITVTNSGATIDNNGKIGKCYYFDGNAHYLQFSKSVGDLYSGDFSYAVWLKPMDDTRSVICSEYASSGASNIAFELSASRQVRLYWDGSPDISSTGCILPKSQWTHIVITRSGNEAKFYMNGELKYTYTGTLSNKTSTAKIRLGDDYRGGTGVSYMGYMNDFRLYDHALSPKEVEILSRGLVCHYPLNGGGRGGDNLLKNTGDLTLWTKEGGITTTWDSEKNMYKIEDSAHTNSRWGIYQDINVEANTSYTITVTLDGTACGAGFAVYDSSTSFPPAVIGTTGRQSYTLTSGANSTKARVYLYTNCGVSKVAWFSLPKVEKGDKSTPWMPNSADAEYTKMGYDSTTEYDVSGYQYNMDSHGSITYSSDSPRYSVCPYYQNTNMYLSATSPTSTIRTISFWVKYTSEVSGYRVAFGDYKSHLAFGMINLTSACVTCGGQSKDTFTITAPTANKWYHIVVKRASDSDSADVELYINGVKQTTRGNADNWNHNSDTLMIGRRATGSSVVGYMSDFRAYVTPLTEAQIAELYNTGVSLANNGTLMGYELVEV